MGVAQQVMYSSFLPILDCVTPCLPSSRLKSSLGEAAEEDNKDKMPRQDNFSVVEYFRVYEKHEDRQLSPHQLSSAQLS